jgi:hypothetical protein
MVPIDIEQLPQAFFSENPGAKKLRDKLLAKNMIHEEHCNSETLSQIFYSDENIELINKQIVLTVYKKTDGKMKIPFQSKDDLKVVMRWVYINYARNLPFKIKEQIKDLNTHVTCQVVPNLITASQQYLDYLRDIEKPREPLPPPVNASRDRTLPSISEIYHGNIN